MPNKPYQNYSKRTKPEHCQEPMNADAPTAILKVLMSLTARGRERRHTDTEETCYGYTPT